MSLQRVIAAPFKQSGSVSLSKQQLVVGLSLHRDWFSPDQAKQVVTRATEEGLLTADDGSLSPAFDPGDVRIPRDFSPDESIFVQRSAFEQMLDALVASGEDKREAVSAVNRLQKELNVTIEAAAAIYATNRAVDVSDATERALAELA